MTSRSPENTGVAHAINDGNDASMNEQLSLRGASHYNPLMISSTAFCVRPPRALLWRNLLIFMLSILLLAGCGGLAGEPRVVSTLVPSTPVPTDIGHPTAPPDVTNGAQLFADNCTRCHGADGKGNGELVQSEQVPQPLDFTNPATSDNQTLVNWYNTITNGNIEHFMPPWRDALSETERWNVAMYTYTLSETQEQIARGHDLYSANCGDCDISTLTDLTGTAMLSRSDVIARLGEMPAFSGLSDAERRDVAAYVQTLSLAHPEAIGTTIEQAAQTVEPPTATQEITATSITVAGDILNGSAGSSVPSGLPLTLFIFDANLNQQQITGSANADGSYRFADVPLDLASTYVVTTNYRERIFASDLLTGDALRADAGDGSLDLPITVYELTEDPDVIQITGLVTQVTVVGDSLQVAQVFSITNTSDRAFTSSQNASNGQAISLAITLPPGAVVAGFPDNQNRYVVDQDNFTVFDTVPVLPDEQHIVQLIYLIPYNDDAIIEQPMNYALSGPVRLLLTPQSVQVISDQLQTRGQETVGTSQYASYGADLTLAAGDVLRYELRGAGLSATEQADRTAPVVSSNNLLLIVVVALVIVGLLVGGFFLIASRNRSGDQQVIDILVRQIAELDSDHEAGKIADDAYTQQRSALKARLAALMERKKS